MRISAARRDPFFRQLAERPSYFAAGDLEIATTWRLEKLLPWRTGLALPLTLTYNAARADPEFLTGADLRGEGIDELRTPKSGTTTIALQARRATPVAPSWYAPLVNNVGLSMAWNGTEARTAYQRGRTRGFDVGADYAWLTPGLDDGPGLSLVPSVVRVISNLSRASGAQDAFVRPTLDEEEFRRTGANQSLWRSSSSVEFHPAPAVTARWDALSLRDLRDYGDLTPNAVAASRERVAWGGVDVGLERERTLGTTIRVAPAGAFWFRPRLELASGYTMLRDPNLPGVTAPGADGVRLASRFGNSQRASVSAVFDLPRLTEGLPGGGVARSITRFLGPIDVSVGRDQLSAYDAAPLTPGWRYQFGLDGVRRRAAGRQRPGHQRRRGHEVRRVEHADTAVRRHHCPARAAHGLAPLFTAPRRSTDAASTASRWSTPTSRSGGAASHGAPTGCCRTLSATVRAVHTRQAFVSPPETPGWDDRTPCDSPAGPIRRTLTFERARLTTCRSRWRSRDPIAPTRFQGPLGESRSTDGTANLTKAFPLPASWKLPGGLRTQIVLPANGDAELRFEPGIGVPAEPADRQWPERHQPQRRHRPGG